MADSRRMPPTDASPAENAGAPVGSLDSRPALSRAMARLDVAVIALIAVAAGAIAVLMPQLVLTGGIETARSFAHLPASLVPRLIFGTLAVVGVFALAAAIGRLRAHEGASDSSEFIRMGRAAAMALIAALYAAIVTSLGFILATMIITAIIGYYLGLRSPISFIPGVLIVPILIRFVFERLLLISLPRSDIESIGLVEDAVMRTLAQLFLG